jgi:Leucine-rich repeat (LRR) protein
MKPAPEIQKFQIIELTNGRQRRIAPRDIVAQSSIWENQLSENQSGPVTLPEALNIDHVTLLLNALYLRRNLTGEEQLRELSNNEMNELSHGIARLCIGYLNRTPYYDDAPYGEYLVALLSNLNATGHKPLMRVVAYTLLNKQWSTFKDDIDQTYRQLLRNKALESAAQYARYAYLLQDVKLSETDCVIDHSKPYGWSLSSLLHYFSSSEVKLVIPKGSCTFRFGEYLEHKPLMLSEHTTNNSCEFDGFMLSNIDDLSRWKHVQHHLGLSLSFNYLQTLPPNLFTTLAHLKWLNLSHNYLESLAQLCPLTNLRRLHVAHNQLETLTSLSELPALEALDVSNNRLTTAQGISLSALKYLDLSHNQLTTLSSLLLAVSRLQTLKVAYNQITTLEGFSLGQLTSLDASYNKLPAAPSFVSQLHAINVIGNLFLDPHLNPERDLDYQPQATIHQTAAGWPPPINWDSQ